MEDTSSPTPTVDLLSSMVVTTNTAKEALVVLGLTTSNRAATASLRADMADSTLLLEVTGVEDTSSSTATAGTADDLCRAFFLDIET
jgi:hypothetical protein